MAARYAGHADAKVKLAAKIKTGGSGVWGATPMPPQAQLSQADIERLVDWILSLH